MLYSPLWKRLLILALCAWGIVASLPNLFYTDVEAHNDAATAIEANAGVATPERHGSIWRNGRRSCPRPW